VLAVVVAAAVGVWATPALFVRRLPRFSRTATVFVLCLYAALPGVVPLLQLAADGAVTPPGGHVVGLLGFVIFFAAVFGVTLLAIAVATDYARHVLTAHAPA
jgi:hypothetical protein